MGIKKSKKNEIWFGFLLKKPNFVHPNACAVASAKAQWAGLNEIPEIEIKSLLPEGN